MTDLLTTRQLMDMLHLDRTTIYRMLNDGQLPALRVGGQWRFSRPAVEAWLQGNTLGAPAGAAKPHEAPDGIPSVDSDVLPLHCVQPIQDVFAELAEVSAVTTDLEGKPLTTFSSPCAFCSLILATEAGRARCRADWRRLADQKETKPHLEKCHAGLTYARGRIKVEDRFIAMIFGGQFVVGENTLPDPENIAHLAQVCEVDETALAQAAQEIPVMEPARTHKLLEVLQIIANTFCMIGQERLELTRRLKRVAEIAGATQ